MENIRKQKGFSLIEVLAVMAIGAVLIGLATTYYSNSQVRTDIHSQASNLVHYLRLSQSAAISGQDNANHGIHFDENGYTVFVGTEYDEEETSNVVKNLDGTLFFSEINLNGGGYDVIFEKGTGETLNHGTITISSSAITKEIVITINSIGTINY